MPSPSIHSCGDVEAESRTSQGMARCPAITALLLSAIALPAVHGGDAKPTPKPAPGAKPAAPASASLPPDWLPIAKIEGIDSWFAYKKKPPAGPQIWLPPNAKVIRGVFVCYIFHSQDPRDLAQLWDFALLAIPPQCEYDIGFGDKRNPRGTATGLPVGNMGNVLAYLDLVAKETGHPEIAVAPIVGWTGQNGGPIASDLYQRAPARVISWTDSWDWSKYPEIASKVPLANAWELKEAGRNAAGPKGQPTPPKFLAAPATTYGYPHGIYSKFSYFAGWLDRCVQLRLPATPPEPGKPVPLKALNLADGWAGDYSPISAWNPIAPVKDAKGFAEPVWFPDEYTACMWRAYHSNCTDLRMTGPRRPYLKGNEWSGQLGVGNGNPLQLGQMATFTAEVKGDYAKVEFWDGNIKLGECATAPWQVEAKCENRGVRAFHVVGIKADGSKAASIPALTIVQ